MQLRSALFSLALAFASPLHAQSVDPFWNSTALASAWDAPLTEDQRVAGLSRAWSEAKFNFVGFDRVPGLDWDAAYLQALPRVRAARDTGAYLRELQAFYAQLHDGHTAVFAGPEAADAWLAKPDLDTALIEGRVFVKRGACLQRGWEIVAIDGRPVRAYAATEVVPYIAASTPQDLDARTYERFLFDGKAGTSVAITARDAQGKSHVVSLPRLDAKTRAIAQPSPAPFEYRLLPGNIAYVALRSFGGDAASKAYLDQFAEIAKADAIVFDLRDNGGGNSSVGYKILATLAKAPFKTNAWSSREYVPTARAWGEAEAVHRGEPDTIAPDAAHHYDKPVFVLTNARTYSAAEDFTVAFDAMQRGRIIGEATGGSTGQPLIIALPGGLFARICTKRDTYPDGKAFVGVGVQPQRVVHPTIADFRAGRDTVLEAALGVARK